VVTFFSVDFTYLLVLFMFFNVLLCIFS